MHFDPMKHLPPIGGPIQRMSIDHQWGRYLVGEEIVDLKKDAILLGAFLQRVMFPPRTADGDISKGLECSSRDGKDGWATNLFPADRSALLTESIEASRRGEKPLPCFACPHKEWTTEAGKKVHPRCTVQIMVPMLVLLQGEPEYTLVSMSYQRSAEKPIREYLRWFTKTNNPTYSVTTSLRLNVNLGNGFKYSTPTFTHGMGVSAGTFPVLSALLQAARKVLTAPPTPTVSEVHGGGMLSVGAPAPTGTYSGSFFG